MKNLWFGNTDPGAVPGPHSSPGHRIVTTLINDEQGNPWRVGYQVRLLARLQREPDRVVILSMTPQELDDLYAELIALRAQNSDRQEG